MPEAEGELTLKVLVGPDDDVVKEGCVADQDPHSDPDPPVQIWV